jgi:sulfane dehydrogenase subunit SoxC
VPLSLLLGDVGVQTGAAWVVAEGAEDGEYTKSIPLEKAMDDIRVAYGQNGEPLRPQQGYPLRLWFLAGKVLAEINQLGVSMNNPN